jgi:hypothetical protein
MQLLFETSDLWNISNDSLSQRIPKGYVMNTCLCVYLERKSLRAYNNEKYELMESEVTGF